MKKALLPLFLSASYSSLHPFLFVLVFFEFLFLLFARGSTQPPALRVIQEKNKT